MWIKKHNGTETLSCAFQPSLSLPPCTGHGSYLLQLTSFNSFEIGCASAVVSGLNLIFILTLSAVSGFF